MTTKPTPSHRFLTVFSILALVCLSAPKQTHADIFNDLIDIIIYDVSAGGGVVGGVAGIMPDPFDLELEHAGAGGFDVDISFAEGCDFSLRIGHFAPIDGFPVGEFDWRIADIQVRDDFGNVMPSVIVDVEVADDINEMPTSFIAITDGMLTIRTLGFSSDSAGAFSDYIVEMAILGDVNEDLEVNLLDVGAFIAVLGSGAYSPQADINQDGAVNLLDIDGFIDLVAG